MMALVMRSSLLEEQSGEKHYRRGFEGGARGAFAPAP
jgi:hypothetical protein